MIRIATTEIPMKRALLACTAVVTQLLLTACAANPPKELLSARAAYDEARTGKAQTVTPADVAEAREALLLAERSFDEDGDTMTTRSYAYVAERRAQRSMVRAGTLAAGREKDQSQKRLLGDATRAAEARTLEVSEKNQELRNKDQQLRYEEEKLRTEQRARSAAEQKASEAMARLTALASIKHETRGLVITLPGGVLFETNKAVLLGTAEERLSQVADALLADREATMVVEGHTDSQGNDALNAKLSLERASSVRDYLVKRGVAADRITAAGKGSKNPIADNQSAEGRANNRRVEIVVSGRNGNALKMTTITTP